jgi:hypothetical protein
LHVYSMQAVLFTCMRHLVCFVLEPVHYSIRYTLTPTPSPAHCCVFGVLCSDMCDVNMPDALLGWQDVLSCPFCLDVATECIRLTHSDHEKDCGVCACVMCVKNWLSACDVSRDTVLGCPRCRHPLFVTQLHKRVHAPNPGDPLITRLLADVPAQCRHCGACGTVASMAKHNPICTARQLATLRDADAVIHQAVCTGISVSGKQWVDAFEALHTLDVAEAERYLVQWLTASEGRGIDYVAHRPFRSLFVSLPSATLTACEMAWGENTPKWTTMAGSELYDLATQMEDGTTIHTQLLARFAHTLESDDPTVLTEFVLALPSHIMRHLPRTAVRDFIARIPQLLNPTTAHVDLLVKCLESCFTPEDECDAASSLKPVLAWMKNIDTCWSNPTVARCIFRGSIQPSAMTILVPSLKTLWLKRCELGTPWDCTHSVDAIIASLISGAYQFERDTTETPALFAAVSTIGTAILTCNVLQPHHRAPLWTAFTRDLLARGQDPEGDGHPHPPLILSPMVAMFLWPAAEQHNPSGDVRNALRHLLMRPYAFLDVHATVAHRDIKWTASWLGHFTLADRLGADTDAFVPWQDIPDGLAESLLMGALEQADLWHTADDEPLWNWARIVVRLATGFVERASRISCVQAAHTVAQHIGHALVPGDVCPRNWTTRMPIFGPHPSELLSHFLGLLADDTFLQLDVLSVFLRTHTEAVLNRLLRVSPLHWTEDATMAVVRHTSARWVERVAWSSWFRASVSHYAQRGAIRTMGSRSNHRDNRRCCTWVTLLRVTSVAPSGQRPPRHADAMNRLVSVGANGADVDAVLTDWLVHPTPAIRASLRRWATAALAEHAEAYLLSHIALFCMQAITPSLPIAGFAPPHRLSAAVGNHLHAWTASIVDTSIVDACNTLWLVLFFGDDDALAAMAQLWLTDLRKRLIAVSTTSGNHFINGPMLQRLECRCSVFHPPDVALDCLCMGLHMASRGLLTSPMNTLRVLPDRRIVLGKLCAMVFSVSVWNTPTLIVVGNT